MVTATIIHLLALTVRSLAVQHPPFTNLYETFLLLSFLLALRLVFWKRQFPINIRWLILSIICIVLFTALVLPASYKLPKPLMPALNSIWMYIHVPSYFFGYMALIWGFIYAVILLVHRRSNPEQTNLSLVNRMDTEIKIAFLFLNIGMATGGIWAFMSWGNYWAWDPKETWALISWVAYAAYLHARVTAGWRPNRTMIIGLVGYATLLFNFFGVNILIPGLHSYAGI